MRDRILRDSKKGLSDELVIVVWQTNNLVQGQMSFVFVVTILFVVVVVLIVVVFFVIKVVIVVSKILALYFMHESCSD